MIGTRARHPDLAWRCYANLAAIGPLPDVARAAMHEATDRIAREGVGAIYPLVLQANLVRERFAALVGADPGSVALVGNTSDGVVAIAHALPWRRGDRILLFEGEFPTNTTPWQVAADLYGLELVWVRAEELAVDAGLERVHAELRRGLRLVAVSAVQFQTGLRMPIETLTRLAHAHGAEILVDGIQAIGGGPFAMGDVDYLACGGQKWLMGPMGTGMLAVRPDRWTALVPRLASWLSHVDPLGFLGGPPGRLTYDRALKHGPSLFEGGGRNLVGHAGLAASLGLLLEVGVDAVGAHAGAWNDRLEPALVARGFRTNRAPDAARRSSILSVDPPAGHDAAAIAAGLAAAGVSVATPDGRVRFAPGMMTALDEVDLVVAALDEVLAA